MCIYMYTYPVVLPPDEPSVQGGAPAVPGGGPDVEGSAASKHRPFLRLLEGQRPRSHGAGPRHRAHDLRDAQNVPTSLSDCLSDCLSD